jgi:hypothetical protein
VVWEVNEELAHVTTLHLQMVVLPVLVQMLKIKHVTKEHV